mmetsp:Transcript_79999/g.259308  ORF Transcript_79999/g.259308 Transcript_79999/m.259308 type:complete len:201 (-) Transcript_79999:2811-3413(-)
MMLGPPGMSNSTLPERSASASLSRLNGTLSSIAAFCSVRSRSFPGCCGEIAAKTPFKSTDFSANLTSAAIFSPDAVPTMPAIRSQSSKVTLPSLSALTVSAASSSGVHHAKSKSTRKDGLWSEAISARTSSPRFFTADCTQPPAPTDCNKGHPGNAHKRTNSPSPEFDCDACTARPWAQWATKFLKVDTVRESWPKRKSS